MRKQLLLAGLVGIFLSAAAGEGGTRRAVQAPRKISTPVKAPQFRAIPAENSASRADRSLSKIAVSSSGNLYGVVRSSSNCVDADDSLNSVIFTFRTDDSVYHGSNSSRYRFVLSTDGGATFTSPSKELNKNVVYANSGVNARYPQGLIYRAPGVTVADSAYVVYSGTWHNGSAGIWSGESRGVGQLGNDSTTFTEHDPNINTGLGVYGLISSSLAKGGNKFYNVNEANHSTSYTTDAILNGLTLMTGQWNASTKDVDWTDTHGPTVSFDVYPTQASQSLYGGQTIAFDPTGQTGYWVGTGDINPGDGIAEMKPFFSKTTDGGQNWSDFETIALDSITSFQRPPMVIDPNSGDSVASSINIYRVVDVAVDYLGNPHIGIVAQLNINYDVTAGSFISYGNQLFDLTTGSNLCNSGWIANYIKPMHSLFSQFTGITDETSTTGLTDDYRLQASRSQDGKYIFFLWNETDSTIASQFTDYDNQSPDLLGVGIDIVNAKTTAIKNFTAGDGLFGGQTPSFAGGSVGGSFFSLVSPTALSTGSGFTVPVTVSQPDYLHPTASPKNGELPAKNWYLQNVSFALSEFTLQGTDHDPPVFSHVADTVIVHLDSSLTTVLPTNVTAFDCHDGDVTGNIQVNTSGVNTGAIGTYTVTYSVSDSAGNVGTGTTTVLVEAEPVAVIGSVRLAGNKYTFIDSSLNMPTARVWKFSNNSPPSTASQVTKTFSVASTITVCLKVSNYFGVDSTCKDFDVVLGIQNVEMNNSISVFPTTTSGQVTVEVNRVIDEDMTVSVYNMAGAIVSSDNTVKRNTSSTTLSFSNLSNGVYQLKIGNEKDGYAVKPVVIQK